MTQLSLLPVELADEFESDRSRSKDLLWTGIDTQDRRYVLKTVEPDIPALPATEWLYYQLCMLRGIPAPDFAIVTRLGGRQAFGSHREDGAHQHLKEETSPADNPSSKRVELRSKALVLDMAKHSRQGNAACYTVMAGETSQLAGDTRELLEMYAGSRIPVGAPAGRSRPDGHHRPRHRQAADTAAASAVTRQPLRPPARATHPAQFRPRATAFLPRP